MANQEKIKEFLSDKQKMSMLAKDKDFMDKIFRGQATPETYSEELKKFGIELSDKEADELQESVNKILEKSSQELDSTTLEHIVGGKCGKKAAVIAVAATPIAAGLGCAIAGCVYYAKAQRAEDESTYLKFIDKATNCGIAAASLALGSAVLGAGFDFIKD